MKKNAMGANKKKPKDSKLHDKIMADFAEIKDRQIRKQDLVWGFRLSISNDDRIARAIEACVAFLQDKLGRRCRVAIEKEVVGKNTFHDITLKSRKLTLDTLLAIDRGMAACAKQAKVKYVFLGYSEDLYDTTSWKTLGSVLEDFSSELSGELDCRTLSFDGLYRHDADEDCYQYLRFYSDGLCIYENTMDSLNDAAKWLKRERKGLTTGSYKVKGTTLSAEVEQSEEPGEDPTVFKLKGRLTKQGLKVRVWSSYSGEEFEELYAFHQLKLK